ncbi:hypothetical protein MRX96_008280 [Rhipicephalus microplus]
MNVAERRVDDLHLNPRKRSQFPMLLVRVRESNDRAIPFPCRGSANLSFFLSPAFVRGLACTGLHKTFPFLFRSLNLPIPVRGRRSARNTARCYCTLPPKRQARLPAPPRNLACSVPLRRHADPSNQPPLALRWSCLLLAPTQPRKTKERPNNAALVAALWLVLEHPPEDNLVWPVCPLAAFPPPPVLQCERVIASQQRQTSPLHRDALLKPLITI